LATIKNGRLLSINCRSIVHDSTASIETNDCQRLSEPIFILVSCLDFTYNFWFILEANLGSFSETSVVTVLTATIPAEIPTQC